jgi:FdhE protein
MSHARDAWLAQHPYLRPLAELDARVETALNQVDAPPVRAPTFESYASYFVAGVPLLASTNVTIDLEPVGRAIVALIEKLATEPLLERVAADVRALAGELETRAVGPRRIAGWLRGDAELATSSPGLLRYLGWTAAAHQLRPSIEAFEHWRQEECWLRAYCPTCGSLPSMAQLSPLATAAAAGAEASRSRLLVCGQCRSRWRFKRTACPFCAHDSDRLASVAIEGEARLRIDYCESCTGYLKTYAGEGDESFFLADWTSLHLDILARDRGLERLAASLYELEPEPHA